ncbi:style cell-cycle inhibitor 1-A [Heracleum sosnowskyi]|uniref:Style cell-cycle inhibitor 1-A n=1 Tax=Heracleum sosnowskyi TaxID=360622 RepID=A0AAD8N6N5_9APIA|nr:style cell-cycle inhibitor 1-A [Heracleum sosnowskyi]
MGSERKSKEEDKTKKKRDHHPSSHDEGRTKKRKSTDDKSSTKKKHKSDKELKSETKHKDKHHNRDRHVKFDIEEITGDDYFLKNNEFSTWLKEEKSVFFSDLSADSARKMFSKFVEKWNKGKLASQYYEGISTGPRTSHNWKIKK